MSSTWIASASNSGASASGTVAWTSNGQDGSGLGIYAQRYDTTGAKAGAEFKVNKTTAGNQSNPAITGLTGGGFVVAWQGPDANGLGVYMQRYDSKGTAAGTELRVNSVTTNDQSLPSIAALDNGGFVIACIGGGNLVAGILESDGNGRANAARATCYECDSAHNCPPEVYGFCYIPRPSRGPDL